MKMKIKDRNLMSRRKEKNYQQGEENQYEKAENSSRILTLDEKNK